MHEALENTQSETIENVHIPYWELYFIGVHQDDQSKGIGSKLLQEAIQQAEHAKTFLWLDAFTPNDGLVKWYKSKGFQVANEGQVEGTDLAFQSMVWGDIRKLNTNNPEVIKSIKEKMDEWLGHDSTAFAMRSGLDDFAVDAALVKARREAHQLTHDPVREWPPETRTDRTRSEELLKQYQLSQIALRKGKLLTKV
jgi:hypothetical protein